MRRREFGKRRRLIQERKCGGCRRDRMTACDESTQATITRGLHLLLRKSTMKEKLAVSVILMTVVLVPTNVSEAKDFAQADPQRQEWFKGLERPDVPPTARPGQRSCCEQGDVVDTKVSH